MRVEEKRIFISDLPETATKTDIENTFKNYGNIISVEIKERKEMGPKNNSLFFAYVNIKIDDRNLQQCFKDFSNEKWHGHYVILQIARESFLERLKRERKSEGKTQNENGLVKPSEAPQPQEMLIRNIPNGIKSKVIKNDKSSTESDSSDTASVHVDKEDPVQNQYIATKKKRVKSSSTLENAGNEISADVNETVDIIIKNNKGKVIDKNGLKIESVGNKPIIKIDIAKKKDLVNSSEANLKRLQSLKNLKKGYQTQKLLIQSALSKIDNNVKSKVIFDDSIVDTYSKSNEGKPSRMSLFDEDPNEEEFEANFNLREQFQGKEGQKLLELQSKYKNDKRFALDERFLDQNESNHVGNINNEVNEEMSLEEEKKKEYEILEQVLGKKVNRRSVRQEEFQSQKKSMLRFDPTQPEHSKFEIKKELGKQKKRKRNDSEVETLGEKKQDEKEVPEVSNEKFYKVTDNLKESLQEKQEFSLLNMFGQNDKRGEQISDELPKQLDTKTNTIPMGKNPFRYDSSDDEDETKMILNQSQQEAQKSSERVQSNITRNTLWCEPFFFKNDDYRLQEGFEFIEKMKSEEKTEFTKLRRDLKEIVKAKVRNNQRKHKPFKKKLGGNKRKKMIKMKKALKR